MIANPRHINAADQLARPARLGGSVSAAISSLLAQGYNTSELADIWRREQLGSIPAELQQG